MTALLLSTWTLFEFVLLDSIVLVTLVTKLRHQTIESFIALSWI